MKFTSRIVPEFNAIDPGEWDRLDHADNPFLSHAFLVGLEASGSISADTGWKPHHLALYDGEGLAAFAPAYVKSHSHGEFVFDWAWADAYHRHGLDYYPKLLTAVPYSPVSGPRLLTRCNLRMEQDARRHLIQLAIEECRRAGLSSWHCNFVSNKDAQALDQSELLPRSDWQFHWRNLDYESFDDFLARLQSRKRKNILRERRSVAGAGIRFDWKTGDEVSSQDLEFIYRCYTGTFHAYGNHPALKRSFFASLAEKLGHRFLVALASRDDGPVAMSLFLRGGGHLYGRYWGCVQEIPGLHFEAAYYQGIDFCIRNGISVFESGAQGEHKIARGFLPSRTRSYHYIRHDAFRDAVAGFLSREANWQEEYRDALMKHSPYRRDLS